MLNKLLLALLLDFVSSSNLLATDLVIVCASKGNENCANPEDTNCDDKLCTSPATNTCSEFETDYQPGVYHSHTPVPPGAAGKNWLTFTGETVCAKRRNCASTCIVRFGSFELWCKKNTNNPWNNSSSFATFDLTNDCIGPNEGGRN